VSRIWTSTGSFKRTGYASEADFEATISQVQKDLFGPGRIYLDVKKAIGSKSGLRNIPDGYLLDLSGKKPRLYVVENELASHDPLRHIAVQILQFSLSFEEEPRAVKTVVYNSLQQQPPAKKACEDYANANGFRNLDHMLEQMVFETPFAALVIIDEMPETLQSVLARKFQFGVEVLELARYENSKGERYCLFEPFLADLREDVEQAPTGQERPPIDLTEVDTVVVPAREEGFQDVFLGENRWHAVRIHGTMRPQIRHIAAYRVAPVSAITHMASVESIEPWKDTSKVVLNFSQPAHEIGPIRYSPGGRVRPLQGLRYTTRSRLERAKTLDDVW
jgi:hypothetical protein